MRGKLSEPLRWSRRGGGKKVHRFQETIPARLARSSCSEQSRDYHSTAGFKT